MAQKGFPAFVGLAKTNPTSFIGCNDSLEGGMPTVPYTCEARSIDAFLAQVVRYVSSGHCFYIRCRIPDGKDPIAVDEKIVSLYDVQRSRWQRKRRNLKTTAGIHYLRYGRLFVVMLTKGQHEAFYRDHGSSVLDIRRTALKAFGYSIRLGYSEVEKRWRVSVRLDKETYRRVKSHMLTICTWPAYRSKETMEQQFRGLPYQVYGPVREQLYIIAKTVNRIRGRTGLSPVDYQCISNKMRVTKVFADPAAGGSEPKRVLE